MSPSLWGPADFDELVDRAEELTGHALDEWQEGKLLTVLGNLEDGVDCAVHGHSSGAGVIWSAIFSGTLHGSGPFNECPAGTEPSDRDVGGCQPIGP